MAHMGLQDRYRVENGVSQVKTGVVDPMGYIRTENR